MYWRYGIGVEQAAATADPADYDVPRTRFTGPAGANYESVVRMHLSWIDETDVGRLLDRAIAREVLPGNKDNLAEFQTPVEAGAPTHGVLVQPYTEGDCNAEEQSAVVSYSPYSIFGPCFKRLKSVTTNRGVYPWEVLFHELTHALRDASGFGDPTPLGGGLKRYGNNEEFIAVLVTNIYMSDSSNKRADHVGLRKDHKDHHKMQGYLASSLDFFEKLPRYVRSGRAILRRQSLVSRSISRKSRRISIRSPPITTSGTRRGNDRIPAPPTSATP